MLLQHCHLANEHIKSSFREWTSAWDLKGSSGLQSANTHGGPYIVAANTAADHLNFVEKFREFIVVYTVTGFLLHIIIFILITFVIYPFFAL